MVLFETWRVKHSSVTRAPAGPLLVLVIVTPAVLSSSTVADYRSALRSLRHTLTSTLPPDRPDMRFVPRWTASMFVGVAGLLYGGLCQWTLYGPYIWKHGLGERRRRRDPLARRLQRCDGCRSLPFSKDTCAVSA